LNLQNYLCPGLSSFITSLATADEAKNIGKDNGPECLIIPSRYKLLVDATTFSINETLNNDTLHDSLKFDTQHEKLKCDNLECHYSEHHIFHCCVERMGVLPVGLIIDGPNVSGTNICEDIDYVYLFLRPNLLWIG
jgi:hypothetical protein